MSTVTENDVIELIDEAIARQSVKSEEVQRRLAGKFLKESFNWMIVTNKAEPGDNLKQSSFTIRPATYQLLKKSNS